MVNKLNIILSEEETIMIIEARFNKAEDGSNQRIILFEQLKTLKDNYFLFHKKPYVPYMPYNLIPPEPNDWMDNIGRIT